MSEETSFSEESEPKAIESLSTPEPTASGPVSEMPNEPTETASLPGKQPKNAKEFRYDFVIGLTVSAGVNFLLAIPYFCLLGLESYIIMETGHGDMGIGFFTGFRGIWMLVNLIAVVIMVGIILALKRREILKGMVAGYAIVFFITVILGLGLTVACLNPSR
jgi:hypothetical protein